MRYFILLTVLVFMGCGTLSDEDLVKKKKFCADNGMGIQLYENSFGEIVEVHCNPDKKP